MSRSGLQSDLLLFRTLRKDRGMPGTCCAICANLIRSCSSVRPCLIALELFLFLCLNFLFVALELTADLPPQSQLDRWFGEPIKAVLISTGCCYL